MTDIANAPEERLVGSDRVLAVLVELAQHPTGATLDDLSRAVGSSKPTVHRALASLRKAGLATQASRGTYELGDEFVRLANRFQDARPESQRIEPALRALATEFGETAHFAVLDGTQIVYRAKVDPPAGAVRLTSTVGGRNPAYRTAVGKMLLSRVIGSEAELRRWLGDESLVASTPNSIVSVADLYRDLQQTAERGYGIDNQENEVGVNCVAIAIPGRGAGAAPGAVSVSGLTFRCSLDHLVRNVPAIRATVERFIGAA